jgi:hypothetical protein
MPTTNNNWPTPVATDLVKDGWEAIKDLGDAIDTTLGVYAPSTPGLTLINTTSFTGVSSQSINDVFSATYDSYKIIVRYTAASANAETDFRLRVSGADSSANNYAQRSLYYSGSTVAAWKNATDTKSDMGTHATDSTLIEINVNLPFTANRTAVRHDMIQSAQLTTGGFIFSDTTSFTGFSLLPDSGTITGSLSVFGVNK